MMNVETQIIEKLSHAFTPEHLEVINESHMHRVPPQSQTHFKVVLVTGAFQGQHRIVRHRRIHQLLACELDEHIHALSLHLYTPEEWMQTKVLRQSPPCENRR